MRRSHVLLLLTAFALAACGDTGAKTPRGDTTGGKPTIAAVNYPLAYFAERIGGDQVEVVFPAPEDEDPAYWQPDDTALAVYQDADRILLNGAAYAKWVPKVTLAPSKLVDTSAVAKESYIALQETTTHAHGPEGEHAHGGTAFTTWLDPKLARVQVEAVRDALIALLPEHEATFEANAASLLADLSDVEAAIRAVVAHDPKRPLVVSHPVYQYFARAYGLDTKAVHWEPDEVPGAEAWDELKAMLEAFPARWMIWEGEPGAETVDRLAAMGVGSAVFAPCGNRPDTGDFLTVMRQNAKNLEAVFAP